MLCPMYWTNHLNTRPEQEKTRWHPFFRYSNGPAIRYSNCIQILDHLASNLFSTIQIPISLVFRPPPRLFELKLKWVGPWILYDLDKHNANEKHVGPAIQKQDQNINKKVHKLAFQAKARSVHGKKSKK